MARTWDSNSLIRRSFERYMLPEVGETRLVQNTIKDMQSSAKVISISRNQTATKKSGI
jgi:hypothetical protein